MKLFLRSYLAMFFMIIVQGILVGGYFWFLGFQSWGNLLYILFVQIVVFLLFLLYRWTQDHRMYQWLNDKQEERFIPKLGDAPFAERLYDKQQRIKRMREKDIQQAQTDLDNQVTFMNQWVHQMKTPISVIHLMIQDEDDEWFQNIRKELYLLEDGLQTVLYSSRLSVFEKDYIIEQICLHDLINEVIQANRRLFIQYKVFPKKDMPESEGPIYTDQKWLKFAIGQLLSNAVKYSSEKSNEIEFKTEERSHDTVLEIKDFGIGIPSQDMRRVFDPYFTGANGRLYHESTGMGLFLVKEIMDKLHHQIELESQEGYGTTFTIYFSTKDLPEDQ
ncbi:HAMP domain-containing histidine kinase [Salibacterium sp. K-3]